MAGNAVLVYDRTRSKRALGFRRGSYRLGGLSKPANYTKCHDKCCRKHSTHPVPPLRATLSDFTPPHLKVNRCNAVHAVLALVVRKNSTSSHLTEMLALICQLPCARKRKKPALPGRKHFSARLTVGHPDRPCFDSFREHKALTGFSAYLDHRSGRRRASFLPSPFPLAHSPQRGSPVFAKAAGLLSGETGPTETIERLRPFLPNSLVSSMQLEGGLGHRQTRDPDRLAAQEFPVVLEREVASWSATNS